MKTTSRRPAASKTTKKPAPPKKKTAPVRTANLDRAIKEYEEALKTMGRKDYARAAHQFEAIIKEYPIEREVCDRSRIYLNVCKSHTIGAAQQKKGVEDPYYLGVIAVNDGRLDDAAELFEKMTKQHPESDKAWYALAAIMGLRSDAAGAVATLRKAIELNAANRAYALNDADFDSLRENTMFMEMLGKAPGGSE